MPHLKPVKLVSVIIACRNEAAHIGTTLRSILAQKCEPRLEVIVADGLSNDDTGNIIAALASQDPRISLIENASRITAAGLNLAIKHARGDIIVRADGHSEYAPDYVQQCIHALSQTGADNVGGPMRTKADSHVQQAIAAASHISFATGGGKAHDINYEGYVDTVMYGCWYREIFDRVGLFDDQLVRNQDDEYNYRIRKNGGKIWQTPRIHSRYSPRASIARLFSQYFRYGYWKVRIMQKHGRPTTLRQLAPPLLLLTIGLLATVATFSAVGSYGLTLVLSIYLLSGVVAAALNSNRFGWRLVPILPVIFITHHVAYGLGYLGGIIDFLVLRRTGTDTGNTS